jgi:hypothetical protein
MQCERCTYIGMVCVLQATFRVVGPNQNDRTYVCAQHLPRVIRLYASGGYTGDIRVRVIERGVWIDDEAEGRTSTDAAPSG